MNTERLAEIAEWLETGAPEKNGVAFDMRRFKLATDCGTTCCIGGAAVQFFGNKYTPFSSSGAASMLVINDETAKDLFYPEESYYTSITPDLAARCIRKLITTEQVDWEGTRNA